MASTIDESYIPDIDYGSFEGGDGTGKKTVIIAVLAIVVLGLAALAVWHFFLNTPAKPTMASITKDAPVYSLSQQTLNLSDGHLLQVTVQMQLTTLADTKKIGTDSPQINDAEIAVFGSMSYQQLLTTAGKQQAKNELTSKFQWILGKVQGLPQVTGVYFTDFVMQ